METVGIWRDLHAQGPQTIRAFKTQVGVGDCAEFLVGGDWASDEKPENDPRGNDDYFSWGVLENAQGKTTEIFR